MALLPEESVTVATWPMVAVESPGRIIPEDPGIAKRVLDPITAMAAGEVVVGEGGVLLWRNSSPLLCVLSIKVFKKLGVEVLDA